MNPDFSIIEGQSFELPDLDLPADAAPLEMIWVGPGTFLMGSPPGERGRYDDERQVEVTLTRGFWLGRHLVTQAQYEAVVPRGNRWPSLFGGLPDSADRPVERVTWDDAVAFCQELNRRYASSLPGNYRFALPTEAQWEYACRAGTRTRYHSGDADEDLDRVAWHAGNSGGTTHPVGQQIPNAWGFYDMHGNVSEWCHDYYDDDYPEEPVADWEGPSHSPFDVRTVRGSAWSASASYGVFRSAARCDSNPHDRLPFTGFRLCLRWHHQSASVGLLSGGRIAR